MKLLKKYNMVIIIAAVFVVIFGCTLFDSLYRTKVSDGMIIVHDIALLKEAFDKIHKDCQIIDFDEQKNQINFLNVITFTGSEVGPMNLAHPQKWQGPYLKDNPTLYHIPYQIISTRKGYYITPGDGVLLPNKKRVGKDILLNSSADIEKMMTDSQALYYKDKPLAAKINLGKQSVMQFFLDDEQ